MIKFASLLLFIATAMLFQNMGPPESGSADALGSVNPVNAFNGAFSGWAIDPANGQTSIDVEIYVDDRPGAAREGLVRRLTTTREWVSVDFAYPQFTGRHAFNFRLPETYFDGRSHQLYVYAVAPNDRRTLISAQSFTLSANPILGEIESVTPSSLGVTIRGWTCQKGVADSIRAHVYVGASAYFSPGGLVRGSKISSGRAGGASSDAVAKRCGAGANHDFSIRLDPRAVRQYQGLPLFVHGIRVRGNIENSALARSGTSTVPLSRALEGRLLPGVARILLSPERLESLVTDPAAKGALWANARARAAALNARLAGHPELVAPYYGVAWTDFHAAAIKDLSSLPYLAIVCAVDNLYCETGAMILRQWSKPTAAAVASCSFTLPPLRRAGTALFCAAGFSEAGLTLGRYLGSIGESYALLAAHLSESDRAAVREWLADLGVTIKKSSFDWNRRLAFEGANNHLAWHDYGMVIAGLLTDDDELIDYALSSPQNQSTDPAFPGERNLLGLLRDGIYEADNPANKFRSGASEAGVSFDLGGNRQVRDGEIWDRMRHVACGHPIPNGCGFGYSQFNLQAMSLTARLADANGLVGNAGPIYAFADPNAGTKGPSLLAAARFQGSLIADPAEAAGIRYEPYRGELPLAACGGIGVFMILRDLFPEVKAKLLPSVAEACRKSSSNPNFPFDGAYPKDGLTPLYLSLALPE